MKRKWGNSSRAVYTTLDPRLKLWCDVMLQQVADISLLYGHRGEQEQNEMFERGASTLRFPDSKHNYRPSMAVDLQPYPRPLHEAKLWGALGYLAGRGHQVAEDIGITLRWGGDWNRDGDLTNQKFDDLFHWEIVD